jgi:hypothetical protein
MSLSSLFKLLPPRVAAFFCRGVEMNFHSETSQQQLLEQFRRALQYSGWGSYGASGYVLGGRIHICWSTGMFRDSFTPVFHGRVEAIATGSRITGRMSHNRLVQIFTGIWCSAVILISIVFIWTVLMPLAGYAMLWAANGIMAIGEQLHPGRDQRICEFIQSTCDNAGS